MPENKKIRAYIADDFDMMRQVIYRLVERSEDVEMVGEATELQEALDEVQTLQPDVILMNDYLPPTNSAVAAKLFRELGITAGILVISMHVEPDLIHESLGSGANGFMHKSEMGELLIEAIRKIHSRDEYLSPKAKDALVKEVS